ncbi:hypothetical protein QBC46DRAFT_308201 [Diplogelasinospora grovesii]|uniref:AAA+ ATPase domain-containing protein n=1 Tax=Diplogelasinospora grovesii TaxID=303347 RepID=A0AAN6ND78_9PEZI|nr:hypothetical protein QBC46DRAFT_308201 [Diplogelasinospora grovesii]
MPPKRKRDILEGFDPNKSDSEDENFDPTEERPPRTKKKSKPSRSRKSGSSGKFRKRTNRYGGSDVDDDEELSDSDQEDSFDEEEQGEDEEDEDAPLTATGRRMRNAAVKHQSYKESSEDSDDIVEDSDVVKKEQPKKPATRPSRIVVLKTGVGRASQRPRRGTQEQASAPPPPTRRATRARTEEIDEPLIELSNSGRHAQVARASTRSRSPEMMHRATRATRGAKGLKKPPAPIEEATQETDPIEPENPMDADEIDELAALEPEPEPEPENQDEKESEAQVEGDIAQESEAEEPVTESVEEEPAKTEEPAAGDDDDDDDAPITRRTRAGRTGISGPAAAEEADESPVKNGHRNRLSRKSRLRSKKSLQEPSSDFEPGDESGADEMSASEAEQNKSSHGRSNGGDESTSSTPVRGRRNQARGAPRRTTRRGRQDSGDEEVELDKEEMAEELEELRESSRSRPRRATRRRSPSIQYEENIGKKRRTAKPVDYSIQPIDLAALEVDDDAEPAATPARGGRRGGRNGGNGAWERSLNTTYGPFGGGGGNGSLLGGPWGTGATGGVDSDSSDDEMVQRSGIGGTVGMTPTSATPAVGLFGGPAPGPPAGGIGGIGDATPNVGKLKNQKALADADPLGVDMSVDFSKVGGLQGHIDQLKEMVQLPLLYPELFQKFHVTPPRGVLFHGPPGTGKTLLARALANSIGSGGRKISFYMRKGADALSKWVGEAEKQLRLLFEEARRTQPSIIFFDEIDGLAPVRSSKQEQIHASIVSTLLALMDGMDGRGQVIVIGATNRPDNIDPALRRPGRFDREFYFPLPDLEARKSIIDIHTKDWGISDQFKHALAENTKGYGGADLRALCTEAALNAIQRTYPQIYTSKEKLVVNPDKITIHATDFMLSIKKLIPSSERSASSSASPLPRSMQPLLGSQYKALIRALDEVMPRKKKITALEEAMYEPYDDADHGFGREAMHQEFERSRVFRPRLLVGGLQGMGQGYLASAVLHHLEGVHVQNFDLATLLGDGRPLEQVIVGLFTEVKRHKPSVIFIPNIDAWWAALSESALTTFVTMLRNIPPTDAVLLLATAECLPTSLPVEMLRDLFGFSKKNRTVIGRPTRENRAQYFDNIVTHLRKSPSDFPDPTDRRKRVLENLPVAPPPAPRQLTKEEIKAQRKADLHHLNLLKMRLQPIMDQIHRKYRKFRQPVIPVQNIAYLFDESDPHFVRPDLTEGEKRPYEIAKDKEGTDGIREVATGKFFYNLETTTIEERLANGYYARPIDFYKDINRLYLDAKNIGDRDRALKANELRTNVEVDVHDIGQALGNQGIRFEEIYQRQLQRVREAEERARKKQAFQPVVDLIQSDLPGDGDSDSNGPVGIGIRDARTTGARFAVMSPRSNGHNDSSEPSHLTNGTSVPSRQDGEDTQMGGTDDDATQSLSGPGNVDILGPSRQWPVMKPKIPPLPLGDSTRATAGGTQMSQRSAFTTVPPGMSPSAIQNDASTTKTSDPSTNRTSSGQWSTQRTNGLHGEAEGQQSQLIDTQSSQQQQQQQHQSALYASASQATSSSSTDKDWAHSQAAAMAQGILPATRMSLGGGGGPNMLNSPVIGELASQSQQSQSQSQSSPLSQKSASQKTGTMGAPAIPAPRRSSLAGLLNETTTTTASGMRGSAVGSLGGAMRQSVGNSSSGTSSQQPVIHEGKVHEFLTTLADRTSGCSVEQLEQINRELMDEIWKSRHEWNRMHVLTTLTSVFNDTIGDIEYIQGVLADSQAQQERQQQEEELERNLLEGEEGGEERQPFIYLRAE